jgi:hypothetical protein
VIPRLWGSHLELIITKSSTRTRVTRTEQFTIPLCYANVYKTNSLVHRTVIHRSVDLSPPFVSRIPHHHSIAHPACNQNLDIWKLELLVRKRIFNDQCSLNMLIYIFSQNHFLHPCIDRESCVAGNTRSASETLSLNAERWDSEDGEGRMRIVAWFLSV